MRHPYWQQLRGLSVSIAINVKFWEHSWINSFIYDTSMRPWFYVTINTEFTRNNARSFDNGTKFCLYWLTERCDIFTKNTSSINQTPLKILFPDASRKKKNDREKILTWNDFASLSRLEAREDCALIVGRVHTSLNALLEHRGSPAWPEVVGELLDSPLVQMGPHLAVLV